MLDSWIYVKMVIVTFVFLFWIMVVFVTITLADYSGKTGESSDLETFVELTPDEAISFTLSWFLTIFVWGNVINELRIVIISLLAPIRA